MSGSTGKSRCGPAFVVLEGIDGAGTTTQAGLLADWLGERGVDSVVTSEPSTGPAGCLIRQILAGRWVNRPGAAAGEIGEDILALLFAADRLDHIRNEIEPALASGKVVVCDRYYHSSLVYQGRGGRWQWVRQLNSMALEPDVTYVLRCPAEVALGRLKSRSTRDSYERLELQRELEKGYDNLPSLLPDERIVVVDASRPVEQVQHDLRQDLAGRLGIGKRDL